MDHALIVTKILMLCLLFRVAYSYKSNTALSDIIFTSLEPSNDNVQSEYYFGTCTDEDKVLVGHHHWTYEQIKGKIIVRERLSDLDQAPTCVHLKAESPFSESIRYQAFKFNFCFCTIIYNYSGRVWRYLYYEWYIPVEMARGLSWDLYFYNS